MKIEHLEDTTSNLFRLGSVWNSKHYLLEQIAALLKENAAWKMQIEGHTDNVGGETFNQNLSDKRAEAVKDYLVKSGIGAERLQAVGKGLTAPVASNENEIGRAQNRRVELVKN